jgi:hypothetical protein
MNLGYKLNLYLHYNVYSILMTRVDTLNKTLSIIAGASVVKLVSVFH